MYEIPEQLKTLATTAPILLNTIILIISYIIGSFSLSHLISKHKNIKMKDLGSKNYGASNTLILIGKKAGIAVLISDILKVFVSIFISVVIANLIVYYTVLKNHLFLKLESNDEIQLYVSCLGVILGHIFPFYLKFNGGKGFATYIGSVLAISYFLKDPYILIIIIIALILAFITDYIVMATFTVITLTPLYVMVIRGDTPEAMCLLIASLIILIKHRENIINIKENKEFKISSAIRKNKQAVPTENK